MAIAVLTSGGDAPGMNAAVRAVVRRAISRGHEVFAIHEGYAGLVGDSPRITRMASTDVSHILQLGGTVLGTARSSVFRTPEGRRQAVENLVMAGITQLVVIGGDGSLTGADCLREEWNEHLDALVADGRLTPTQAEKHATIGLVGLVGSIDNDLWGTDRTIGCDTALHRIVDAVDTLTSTARSHQRSFVVEVMGRRCGFLALAAGVCCGADHVVLPERPAEDWEGEVCAALRRSQALGRRKSIVLVAEGAKDRNGQPITARRLQRVIERELEIETRTTVLGHVQRGGTPSAYDRVQSTTLGIEAADVASGGPEAPVLLATAGPSVVHVPLMRAVRKTLEVGDALRDGRYQVAVNARGPEFMELLAAHSALRASDVTASVQRRLLFAHVGAPAPGMNAALRTFVRTVKAAGHLPIVASEGLRGFFNGNTVEPDVEGISSLGATVVGTNRWWPSSPEEVGWFKRLLKSQRIDGVVLVGGFGALQAAGNLKGPVAVVPATISNNVPGTDASIGCDTAVNAICEAVDRLKQSAIGSRNRVFFVEVMGRRCGYLARAAGLGSGAELVYTDEQPLTLGRLEQDVRGLNAAMDAGRTVGIVLVADGVAPPFRAGRLADLFREASDGRFDTRVCVLGHLQQGGRPSPADRLLATRLTQAAVSRVLSGEPAALVGIEEGRVKATELQAVLSDADVDARRPLSSRTVLPTFTP